MGNTSFELAKTIGLPTGKFHQGPKPRALHQSPDVRLQSVPPPASPRSALQGGSDHVSYPCQWRAGVGLVDIRWAHLGDRGASVLEFTCRRIRRTGWAAPHALFKLRRSQAFEHQSHFGRVFRRVDGASPSEWRRANAKIPRRTRHGAPR